MSRERSTTSSRRAPNTGPAGRGRYLFLLALIILALGALVGRITYLNVIDRDFLQNQGDSRTLRVEPINAHRGMITDRNGDPLAISTPVVTLWANPQELPDDPIRLATLARSLNMNPDALESRLERYANLSLIHI